MTSREICATAHEAQKALAKASTAKIAKRAASGRVFAAGRVPSRVILSPQKNRIMQLGWAEAINAELR
jgi:hypothetical protein